MRDHQDRFHQALKTLPLLATLRGLVAADALAIGHALKQAGWGLIEVPLASPQALSSIERLATSLPEVVVGAGMVMNVAEVRNARAAGAAMVVSPHVDAFVIRAARDAGLACVAGIATPTEAFAALAAGVTALALFPAEMVPPAALKALRALLPLAVLLPAGGVTLETMGDYFNAGASGFAIGAALYRPGDGAATVAVAAAVFATALDAATLSARG